MDINQPPVLRVPGAVSLSLEARDRESRGASPRGALYRRAPLSEKRSTGSFYRIHPCGAPCAGAFRTLRSATKGRRPLETCELLKKLDQNFCDGLCTKMIVLTIIHQPPKSYIPSFLSAEYNVSVCIITQFGQEYKYSRAFFAVLAGVSTFSTNPSGIRARLQ